MNGGHGRGHARARNLAAAFSGGLLCALAALAGACQADDSGASLARASQARDFGTYRLRRVGLLPFESEELAASHARALQDALLAELSREARWEVVALTPTDLAEVEECEPYRRGAYHPRSILELSRRFQLDGLFVGTLTRLEPSPPQSLGVQLDLVATETGLVIWSSSVQLDSSEERVRQRVERFEAAQAGEESASEGAQLTLLSPSRFARFAAYELARTL